MDTIDRQFSLQFQAFKRPSKETFEEENFLQIIFHKFQLFVCLIFKIWIIVQREH